MQNDRIRLQKYLSECSVASRRKAEELIEQGKVKINGRIAILGDKVSPGRMWLPSLAGGSGAKRGSRL